MSFSSSENPRTKRTPGRLADYCFPLIGRDKSKSSFINPHFSSVRLRLAHSWREDLPRLPLFFLCSSLSYTMEDPIQHLQNTALFFYRIWNNIEQINTTQQCEDGSVQVILARFRVISELYFVFFRNPVPCCVSTSLYDVRAVA